MHGFDFCLDLKHDDLKFVEKKVLELVQETPDEAELRARLVHGFDFFMTTEKPKISDGELRSKLVHGFDFIMKTDALKTATPKVKLTEAELKSRLVHGFDFIAQPAQKSQIFDDKVVSTESEVTKVETSEVKLDEAELKSRLVHGFDFIAKTEEPAIETEEFLPEKTVEPIEQEVSIESTRVSKQEGQDWMLKKLGLIKERFLQAIN